MPSSPRALALCIALAVASAAHAGTITGTVTDAATSLRLPGMVVAAYDAAGALRATATTDPTGLYVLDVPNGDYRVLAYDPNGIYATQFDANAESFETSPLRPVGNGTLQINFALVRGGRINGVVHSTTGTAVAGATIEAYNLSGTRRGFTTADANGNYSLVLPPGDYKLVAFDANGVFALSFHRDTNAFALAQPVHVTQSATTDVFFALPRAALLRGTVVDTATRTLLGGIDVYAYTPEGAFVARTTTAANGAFLLPLPPGSYRIVAADPVRVFATTYYEGERSFSRAAIITLAQGIQRDVQLALERGVLIRGNVGAPNLTVAAYNTDGTLHSSTTSDAEGNYTLVVAPQSYKIAVSDPALTFATRFYATARTFRAATPLVAGSDMSNINMTLERGGRISGTVRDAFSAQPLAGITVAAYDEAGVLMSSGTTGQDGRYAMVVVPGSYRVLAFDPQLSFVTAYAGAASSYEATAPVGVSVDATITADFAMRRGTRLIGRVRNQSGNGVEGVEIFALDAGGNRVAGGVSAGDGSFTIVLAPGTYRFVAIDPESRYVPTLYASSVTVTGSTPAPIEIALASGGRRRAVRH